MRTPKMLAVALVAVVALIAPACSSDDDSAGETTSTTQEAPTTQDQNGGDTAADTEAGESGDDPAADPDELEQELTDDEFTATIETLRGQIDAAGTDVCELIATQSSVSLPTPTNPTQSEMTVGFLADVLRTMADFTEDAGKGDSAATMRTAADELVAEAEAADYSDEFMSQTPAALSGEEIQAAQNDFIALSADCSPSEAPAD